jgi:hypothetical protein
MRNDFNSWARAPSTLHALGRQRIPAHREAPERDDNRNGPSFSSATRYAADYRTAVTNGQRQQASNQFREYYNTELHGELEQIEHLGPQYRMRDDRQPSSSRATYNGDDVNRSHLILDRAELL